MTVGMPQPNLEPRRNTNERLEAFVRELASQAAILMMERHLTQKGQFSEADIALYKQRLIRKFTDLLNENSAQLAGELYSPQEIKDSAKNISYYETAAKKLADYGEKLWKKK